MSPIVDFLIAWQVAALLAAIVLAASCVRVTCGHVVAVVLVCTVAFFAMPHPKGDPKPVAVAEWTTDMRQGWSMP